jgi:hypothetical protein
MNGTNQTSFYIEPSINSFVAPKPPKENEAFSSSSPKDTKEKESIPHSFKEVLHNIHQNKRENSNEPEVSILPRSDQQEHVALGLNKRQKIDTPSYQKMKHKQALNHALHRQQKTLDLNSLEKLSSKISLDHEEDHAKNIGQKILDGILDNHYSQESVASRKPGSFSINPLPTAGQYTSFGPLLSTHNLNGQASSPLTIDQAEQTLEKITGNQVSLTLQSKAFNFLQNTQLTKSLRVEIDHHYFGRVAMDVQVDRHDTKVTFMAESMALRQAIIENTERLNRTLADIGLTLVETQVKMLPSESKRFDNPQKGKNHFTHEATSSPKKKQPNIFEDLNVASSKTNIIRT